jgi:hypothetical protein
MIDRDTPLRKISHPVNSILTFGNNCEKQRKADAFPKLSKTLPARYTLLESGTDRLPLCFSTPLGMTLASTVALYTQVPSSAQVNGHKRQVSKAPSKPAKVNYEVAFGTLQTVTSYAFRLLPNLPQVYRRPRMALTILEA